MKKGISKKQKKALKVVYTKAQSQFLDIRRLALNNSQVVEVSIFRNIFSDLPMATDKLVTENTAESALLKILLAARHTFSDKKKTKAEEVAKCLIAKGSAKTPKQTRLPTPPLVAIELIQPSKQKVRVSSNTVKSTPPKQMRKIQLEEDLDEN